jgi:hypothetical protein
MRLTLTLLGAAAILIYAVLGAVIMNDWAVTAASEESLEQTIATMNTAEQPYTAVIGYVFAAIGMLLALAWATLTLHPRVSSPGWAAVSIWATILALGAPAYFFGAFGNLMSVGDTYPDWNSEAAFAIEAPLYLISGAAAVLAVGSLIAKAVSAIWATRRHDSSHQLSAPVG